MLRNRGSTKERGLGSCIVCGVEPCWYSDRGGAVLCGAHADEWHEHERQHRGGGDQTLSDYLKMLQSWVEGQRRQRGAA